MSAFGKAQQNIGLGGVRRQKGVPAEALRESSNVEPRATCTIPQVVFPKDREISPTLRGHDLVVTATPLISYLKARTAPARPACRWHANGRGGPAHFSPSCYCSLSNRIACRSKHDPLNDNRISNHTAHRPAI